MKVVQPIRSEKKIDLMKLYLKNKSLRDYALFTLGINSGLRISDILNLTFGEVVKGKQITDKIGIYEKKTEKYKYFPLGPGTKRALNEYIASLDQYKETDPLFFSRQRNSRKKRDNEIKALTRQQVYNILKEAAEWVEVDENIGCHTLRKTFGYHAYKRGTPLALIQRMFNHSSQDVTLDYIGITQDEMDAVYIGLDL